MSDLQINTSLELGNVLGLQNVINKQVLPLVHQAVRAVAVQTAADWKANVYQAKLWSGEKSAYANAITWRMTSDFAAVVESTYKYDKEIEDGRPPRDLKKMLDTSNKVRRTKDGRRFLVIPMRQSVQRLEAAGLYEMAKGLAASTVTGQSQRAAGETVDLKPNGGMAKAQHQTGFLSSVATKQAAMVSQNHYAWGGHLSSAMMKQAGVDAATRKWAAGLYKFDTSTPGGGKSSSYLNFRIMMEGSKGWVVPAQPGQGIARKTVQTIQPKAQAAFAAAIEHTLKGLAG